MFPGLHSVEGALSPNLVRCCARHSISRRKLLFFAQRIGKLYEKAKRTKVQSCPALWMFRGLCSVGNLLSQHLVCRVFFVQAEILFVAQNTEKLYTKANHAKVRKLSLFCVQLGAC